MALKPYITARIENHRLMGDKLYNETRDLVEKPIYIQTLLKKYQPSEVAKLMQEHLDTMVAKANAIDMLYNAEVKKAVKDARLSSLPDAVRNREVPADYQAQISNALAFLNAAGQKLTDAEAFSILKPFFNDWELMRQFEKVIMRNTAGLEETTSVRSRFPNALGGILNIADAHATLFDEAEELAEHIFMSPKRPTMSAVIDGIYVEGAVEYDSYKDRAAQDRLVELAERIDNLGKDGAFMLDPGAFSDNYHEGTRAMERSFERDNDNGFIWN
jgi:hypothetical protein